MDNETEVILEQMEGTRASLAQKLETLENQVVGTIQETTSTVSETVHQVQEAVTDTVETVKESVEGTVETVKETFDVRRQVEHHPWLMFGGSLAAGFVAGRLMWRYLPSWQDVSSTARHFPEARSVMAQPSPTGHAYDMAQEAEPGPAPQPERPAEKPGLLASLTSMLGPELEKLKGLAIGTTLGIVRDLLTQSAPPEISSQLADIVNGVTTRLGGEVLPGSILQSLAGDRSSHQGDRGPGAEEPVAAAQHAGRTGNYP